MTEELRRSWGQRIRTNREKLGLSQRAMALRIPTDNAYYRRIEEGETGSQGPSDIMRIRIAAAFGRRVEDIFKYPDTSKGLPAEFAPEPESRA